MNLQGFATQAGSLRGERAQPAKNGEEDLELILAVKRVFACCVPRADHGGDGGREQGAYVRDAADVHCYCTESRAQERGWSR